MAFFGPGIGRWMADRFGSGLSSSAGGGIAGAVRKLQQRTGERGDTGSPALSATNPPSPVADLPERLDAKREQVRSAMINRRRPSRPMPMSR